MVWWVMNDAGNTKNFPSNIYPVASAQLEFQALAYSFPRLNNQYFLENTLFLDWKVVNKGNKKLKTSYLSVWVDVELGFPLDNRVLSHPMKNLGIACNGDSIDEGIDGYGINPPAIGIKILDAPGPIADQDDHDNNRNGIVDEPGERAIFTGFLNYKNSSNPRNGDPNKVTDFYRFQQMRWKDSSRVTFGGDGTSFTNPFSNFMFPGENDPYGFSLGGTVTNPVASPGIWSEETAAIPPGDRRMILSSGPFDFSPGQSVSYKYAFLVGNGFTYSQNVNQLYATSDSLEQIFPLLSQSSRQIALPAQKVRVFPNPARDKVCIQIDEDGVVLEVINASGKKVLSHELTSKEEFISTRNLPSGMYALKFQCKGGIIVQKLFIE